MKVILRQDIHGLGEEGDIKEVAGGYARNFLFPRKMVVLDTKNNRKQLENEKDRIAKQREAKRVAAGELAKKIEEAVVEVQVKAGEKGRLFGTVTTSEIAKKLNEQGFEVEKKKVELNDVIKHLGDYKAKVKLYQDVDADIKVSVVEEK
jgi:large subunit ribosomal protein L9